jgi:hypothetical protein
MKNKAFIRGNKYKGELLKLSYHHVSVVDYIKERRNCYGRE